MGLGLIGRKVGMTRSCCKLSNNKQNQKKQKMPVAICTAGIGEVVAEIRSDTVAMVSTK